MKELTIKGLLRGGPVEWTEGDYLCRIRWNERLQVPWPEVFRDDEWEPHAGVEPMFNALLARTQSLLRAEWEKEQQAKYGPLVEALETCMTFYSVDWAETVQSFDSAKVKAALASLTPPTPKAEEEEK